MRVQSDAPRRAAPSVGFLILGTMRRDELQKLMTEVTTSVAAPYLDAVREALDTVARLEERVAYGERIARLEARLDQLDQRVRDLEQRS